MKIAEVHLLAVDLPFRQPFKHAAAERTSSSSLFLKCVTDSGHVGFGEALPREYVTGETRDGAFELLKNDLLPRLFELDFRDLSDVIAFLDQCDGKAPAEWISGETRQTAAWCTVDLALLDAFTRSFEQSVSLAGDLLNGQRVRFSAVVSEGTQWKTLLMIRMARIPQVKLKVAGENSVNIVRRQRRLLGARCQIRADANMAWDVARAETEMRALAELGVRSFEQPIAADNIEGLRELVTRMEGLDVMVDESLSDKASLDRLIDRRACTAANVRISKCGGLVAARNRCREALKAGLTLQIGCQVGESSLLSAAQLALIEAVPDVTYLEGCFGERLLRDDPGTPLLQFGWGGKPPRRPQGNGFGITMNESVLESATVRRATLRRSSDGSLRHG